MFCPQVLNDCELAADLDFVSEDNWPDMWATPQVHYNARLAPGVMCRLKRINFFYNGKNHGRAGAGHLWPHPGPR